MNFNFPSLSTEFYAAILPILILSIASLVVMLQSVIPSISSKRSVQFTVFVGLGLSALSTFYGHSATETAFLYGAYLTGSLTTIGQVLLISIALLVCMIFADHHLANRFFSGEVTSIFLMILIGMLALIASEDFITLFVGLELSSIGLYAIVGYLHPTRRSQEGAIKYFVLGSFAAALLLFGFSLLYAATGTMRLSEIAELLPKFADHNWIKLGLLFTVAGIGFKLALAPFHLWAPDTYEAAPTGITAFMATAVKVMMLILTIRFFAGGARQAYETWQPGLMFLAMLSMIIGNLMALVQNSIKRMLAYSSIAHSGYLAIALCSLAGTGENLPVAAILFYTISYSIMSIGAFSAIMMLETKENENLLVDDLSGLAKRHPWIALALSTFLFGFAGMPPTMGFMAKFFVFNAAISNHLYSLVLIGVIGSSISLYYYLRVIVKMYMESPATVQPQTRAARFSLTHIILATAVVATVLVGTIFTRPLLNSLTLVVNDMTH